MTAQDQQTWDSWMRGITDDLARSVGWVQALLGRIDICLYRRYKGIRRPRFARVKV